MAAPFVTPRPVRLQGSKGSTAGRRTSFRVPMLRDPTPFTPHREMEPGEAYLQHRRSLHWLREESGSIHTTTRQRRRPVEEVSGSESPSSFFAEARTRSLRLHTDRMDTEGPSKFVEWRVAKPFLRDLCVDCGMFGFQKGDRTALTAEALSAVQELGGRADDFCIVLGRAWVAGHLEVKFHADGQIADVQAEHLRKITRAEKMALQHRSKGWGLVRSVSLPSLTAAGGGLTRRV